MGHVKRAPLRQYFRLRRVAADGRPAFYFEDCYDLRLSFRAIERFAEYFPPWWEKVLDVWDSRSYDTRDDCKFRQAVLSGIVTEPDLTAHYTPIERGMLKGDQRRNEYREVGPLHVQTMRQHHLLNDWASQKKIVTVGDPRRANGVEELAVLKKDRAQLAPRALVNACPSDFWRMHRQSIVYGLPLYEGTAHERLRLTPSNKLWRYLLPERVYRICGGQKPAKPKPQLQHTLEQIVRRAKLWRATPVALEQLQHDLLRCAFGALQCESPTGQRLTVSQIEELRPHLPVAKKERHVVGEHAASWWISGTPPFV
jgi:hypothetical protein